MGGLTADGAGCRMAVHDDYRRRRARAPYILPPVRPRVAASRERALPGLRRAARSAGYGSPAGRRPPGVVGDPLGTCGRGRLPARHHGPVPDGRPRGDDAAHEKRPGQRCTGVRDRLRALGKPTGNRAEPRARLGASGPLFTRATDGDRHHAFRLTRLGSVTTIGSPTPVHDAVARLGRFVAYALARVHRHKVEHGIFCDRSTEHARRRHIFVTAERGFCRASPEEPGNQLGAVPNTCTIARH